MRDLKEFLNKRSDEAQVNEARELQYTVAFIDVKDKDGLPISVTMLVPAKYASKFDVFLEKEEGNIFIHAENNTGSVSY